MLTLALSNGEVILVVVLGTLPVAALVFALGSGRALKQVGKGQFSVQFEHDLPHRPTGDAADASPQVRDAELRQLLEAKAYRQRERGERPVDVEAEMDRIHAEESGSSAADPLLREEVRQLVVARNARRERRGEEPLDVEQEIERQLRDLENLGQ